MLILLINLLMFCLCVCVCVCWVYRPMMLQVRVLLFRWWVHMTIQLSGYSCSRRITSNTLNVDSPHYPHTVMTRCVTDTLTHGSEPWTECSAVTALLQQHLPKVTIPVPGKSGGFQLQEYHRLLRCVPYIAPNADLKQVLIPSSTLDSNPGLPQQHLQNIRRSGLPFTRSGTNRVGNELAQLLNPPWCSGNPVTLINVTSY